MLRVSLTCYIVSLSGRYGSRSDVRVLRAGLQRATARRPGDLEGRKHQTATYQRYVTTTVQKP